MTFSFEVQLIIATSIGRAASRQVTVINRLDLLATCFELNDPLCELLAKRLPIEFLLRRMSIAEGTRDKDKIDLSGTLGFESLIVIDDVFFREAELEASLLGHTSIGVPHILLAIFSDRSRDIQKLCEINGISLSQVRDEILTIFKHKERLAAIKPKDESSR